MKSAQRGESMWSLLAWMAFAFCCLFWLSDYLPAQAEDLQEVVAIAATSPEAKAVVVASLKETPNPNRMELRHMRSRVNEIIVTETAREVTGDKTLEAPSERDATRAKQEAARLAEIESKTWGEMSNEERAEFLASKWPIALVVVLFAWGLLFGFRTWIEAERSY